MIDLTVNAHLFHSNVTDSENTFVTWKEMTRTHPNQSLGTFIFLIILNSMWQSAAFPYLAEFCLIGPIVRQVW